MSITILAMINPFVQSHLILPLQAHSWLEIQASFRLIPHWTRLFIAHESERPYNG